MSSTLNFPHNAVSTDGGRTWTNQASVGAGGVVTVTGAVTGLVNNTDPANPIVNSQFPSATNPANWHAATVAFAQKTLGVSVPMSVMWQAEYSANPAAAEIEIGAGVNSGVASLSTTVSGGVLDCTTSTSAGSSSGTTRAKNGTAAPANNFTANMRTGTWSVATRAKILSTNATSDLFLCALSDEAVLSTYFGVHGATSQTNLSFVSTAGHDLGVAFTANVYLDYMMIANGTTIQCYLGDGTGTAYLAVGTAQDQTVIPVNPGHWITSCLNNATAALAHFQIDKAIALCTSPS